MSTDRSTAAPHLLGAGYRPSLLQLLHLSFASLLPLFLSALLVVATPVKYARADANSCYAKWIQILQFLGTNYAAHAATVVLPTGASFSEKIWWTMVAVFLPFAGLGRALLYVVRHMECHRDDIHKALSRDALVLAARAETWEPTGTQGEADRVFVKLPDGFHDLPTVPLENLNRAPSDDVQKVLTDDTSVDPNRAPEPLSPPYAQFQLVRKDWDIRCWEISIGDSHYEGEMSLPPGYVWKRIPLSVGIQLIYSDLEDTSGFRLAGNVSPLSTVISLVQLAFACSTLYDTRGDQTQRYGYAAYGFTVIPFIIMTVFNLICLAIVRDYPARRILQTPVLAEASKRLGASVHGAYGKLRAQPLVQRAEYEQVEMWTEARNNHSARFLLVKTADGVLRRFHLVKDSDSVTSNQDMKIFGVASVTDCPIKYLKPSWFYFQIKRLAAASGSLQRAWLKVRDRVPWPRRTKAVEPKFDELEEGLELVEILPRQYPCLSLPSLLAEADEEMDPSLPEAAEDHPVVSDIPKPWFRLSDVGPSEPRSYKYGRAIRRRKIGEDETETTIPDNLWRHAQLIPGYVFRLHRPPWFDIAFVCCLIMNPLIQLTVMAALSHLQPHGSTAWQRAMIVLWLIMQFYSAHTFFDREERPRRTTMRMLALTALPAFGGYVVVIQMLATDPTFNACS